MRTWSFCAGFVVTELKLSFAELALTLEFDILKNCMLNLKWEKIEIISFVEFV